LETSKSIGGKPILQQSELRFPYQGGRVVENRKHLELLELRCVLTSSKGYQIACSVIQWLKGAAQAAYDS
jgi:hypothetical protein